MEILKSRLTKSSREMSEEEEEEKDPEETELKENVSPERTSNKRRRRSQLLKMLPRTRLLRTRLPPSVKTEEGATVRVNSDLYFKPLTDLIHFQ